MNGHLRPVFEILLPVIDEFGVDYWVYGGVAIAACVGKFIRPNNDVDSFVKEGDFQRMWGIIDETCNLKGYRLVSHTPKNGRPKLDIYINGKERFSIIPAYVKNSCVRFIFGRVIEEYPSQILERVERHIDGYRFYTSPNECIKQFFLHHLADRKDKINRRKIRIDIEAVFTPEERRKYGFVT